MSDKTEPPSPKRLREAREKGDICKSQDVPSALLVMGVALYFMGMGRSIFEKLMLLVNFPLTVFTQPFDEAFAVVLSATFDLAVALLLPLVGTVLAIALIANIAQVGFLVCLKAAMPKMDNLSPSKWFKKVFAMKNLVEFLKNILKVTVLTVAVWKVLEANLSLLFKIQHGNVGDMLLILSSVGSSLLLAAAGVFCAIAALDFLYQKWHYTKEHMMSKDEVKREYKESEGDPQVKGKRKQLHQELLAQDTMGKVRKAKVLVTNPTHYAIALDYEKGKTPLPVLLAKGEGLMAQRMIAVAKEEGIPIMRNVPLAHALFENGTENSYIPKEFIAPVAEVLRWVQSLSRS